MNEARRENSAGAPYDDDVESEETEEEYDSEYEDEEDSEYEDEEGLDESAVHVSFELTEEDVLQLAADQSLASIKTARVFGGVTLVVVALGVAATWPELTLGLWIVLALASLALVFGASRHYQGAARRSFARMHDDHRRMRVSIDESSVSFEGRDWASHLSWVCLDAWAEYPSAMTLTLGSELRVLPKRVLSERDIHVLMQLAQAHVAAPAPVTPKKQGGRTLLLWIFLVVLFAAVYQVMKS